MAGLIAADVMLRARELNMDRRRRKRAEEAAKSKKLAPFSASSKYFNFFDVSSTFDR